MRVYMDAAYSDWLRAHVPSDATWRTKLSELRRLEAVYGDLDTLYEDDGLESILSDLVYSAGDARANAPNPSKLVIDGDIRNNLASYKSALSRYIRFKQSTEACESDVGDVENTTALTFGLEADLQSALRRNIAQLGAGFEITDGGTERSVASGRIDILAKDPTGTPVVIELKAVPAPPATLAQVLGYMADIDAETPGAVRGIIVAPDFHPRLVSAARMVPSVTLVRYHFAFSFDAIKDPETAPKRPALQALGI